ncbi:prefoldin subunit [Colletotrichum tofieldiae]|uniref:Prefoldin subunit n=1 Tax=Colletotrichum tofieldiae TaxID=708197 RepID=A0A166WJE9_9PEZI|nr:prefoldin subunit [Colletotrichum tofieldiae]
MLSSLRIADVLLLLLITQTTQAGPVKRAERLLVDSTPAYSPVPNTHRNYRRDWNTTSSAVSTSNVVAVSSIASGPTDFTTSAVYVTAQEEQDGATPSPIFVTLDGTTTSAPAASLPATTPEGQIPSTTPVQPTAESQSTPESRKILTTTSEPVLLPPIFSTISLPPHLTSGFQNGSSLYPGTTASASAPISPPAEGVSSASTQTAPLQSSLSFAFPVPGETNAATTTVAERPVASSTLAPVLSSTANVEASSPPTPSTTIGAVPTSGSAVQPFPETPSSVPTTASTTIHLSTPSSTLQVTGTPNNQVPTIRTSTPAASATVSPEVAANNLASAKTFNTLFASLTEQSACAAGQIACVKGNVGICGSDGAFAIQNCGTGTSCFALPMNTTEGVIVGCYDPKVASGILGTPVSAPIPGSSTSAAQAPPASEIASEVTTTITPTIIATYTVSVSPPAIPQTSSAAQAPGFTTTVVVTKTVEPISASSSTTAEEEGASTTSTSRQRTRTSTAEEETTTAESTTAESASIPSTAETTRQPSKPTPSTAPASTTAAATGTFTDTLIVNPIPTDEPSEPPATLVGGTPRGSALTGKLIPTASASLPPGIGVSQGTPILTVFVTVTQKERETVTVTVTKE